MTQLNADAYATCCTEFAVGLARRLENIQRHMRIPFVIGTILLSILTTTGLSVAQNSGGTKVYSEGGQNTPTDKERENGLNQSQGISANYNSARKNLSEAFEILDNATSQADIDRGLQLAKQAQAEANMAYEAEKAKYQQQGRLVNAPTDTYNFIKQWSGTILNNGKSHYVHQMEVRLKQVGSQNHHSSTADEMDREISAATQKSKVLDSQLSSLDNELKTLQTSSKNRSIDDFLAKKQPTTVQGDFLSNTSNSNSGSTGDFLSSASQPKNDFLASNKNEEFIIDKKTNGIEGVKTKSGRTLIPYREWEIVQYKNGIAEVNITVERKSFDCATSRIYKTGYVDSKGVFLDGFEVKSDRLSMMTEVSYYPAMLMTSSSASSSDSRRLREEEERRRKLKAAKEEEERKQCEAECKRWEIQRIKYYKQ